ncbi:MAG: hypothetical protein HQM12_20365 [SAR324 cluster bacterium]|nr:hypothetical protein [SAR324 cluster bacterium]
MSRLTIRMVFNQQSGKNDIYVDLHSDADVLPMEHEKHHRQVLETLLGKGILKPDELGQIKVSRVQPESSQKSPEVEPANVRAIASKS